MPRRSRSLVSLAAAALLAGGVLAGCAGPRPRVVEPPPAPLTEPQRQALEARRFELRQEILALEALPEIQRVLGPYGSLDDAQIGLAERQTDSVARYYRLVAQLRYVDALLR